MKEIKREIEINEFECPFCGYRKTLKTHDKIFDEQTQHVIGYGIDYWECDKCGAENDIGLENFEDDFRIFRKFTDNDDWKGLYDFCRNNDFDGFILSSLAKFYNQQKEFGKAIRISEVLIKLNPDDADAEIITKNAKQGIKNMSERKEAKL